MVQAQLVPSRPADAGTPAAPLSIPRPSHAGGPLDKPAPSSTRADITHPTAVAGENHLVRYAETQLPTQFGVLRTIVYRAPDGTEHVALLAGLDDAGRDGAVHNDVLVRVHSECLTSEAFGSLKCDCKEQLDRALELISKRGRGVVLYLRQEGRGIGLGNKIRAYQLQEQGYDTVDANRALGLPDDTRDYTIAADILSDLGIQSAAVLTNNPLKIEGLEAAGIRVTRRVPHLVRAAPAALRYLAVKGERMGHLLEDEPQSGRRAPLAASTRFHRG